MWPGVLPGLQPQEVVLPSDLGAEHLGLWREGRELMEGVQSTPLHQPQTVQGWNFAVGVQKKAAPHRDPFT